MKSLLPNHMERHHNPTLAAVPDCSVSTHDQMPRYSLIPRMHAHIGKSNSTVSSAAITHSMVVSV